MSCYHPMLGIWNGDLTDSGKRKYKFIGRYSPDYVPDGESWRTVVVPCGQCIGCRLDHSRAWADRMMLELDTAGCGVFVTLTYDNDHLPYGDDVQKDGVRYPSLKKTDLQDYHKRLRSVLYPRKFRFYSAGEYGDRSQRPHYHEILFGLSLQDFSDRVVIGRNAMNQVYYNSPWLRGIWKNGNVLLADVSWNTCAYVARYVTKKSTGLLSGFYEAVGVQPEFSLMSRRPGIGAEYLKLHPDCLDYSSIPLSTDSGGRQIRIPKYYLRRLEVDNPERSAIIKERLITAGQDASLNRMYSSGFRYLESLADSEQEKILRNKSLKRDV